MQLWVPQGLMKGVKEGQLYCVCGIMELVRRTRCVVCEKWFYKGNVMLRYPFQSKTVCLCCGERQLQEIVEELQKVRKDIPAYVQRQKFLEGV